LLSKNLIKANQFALKEKEPIVVDTNPLVAKRIEAFTASTGGFQSGLNAPEIDPSLYEDFEETEEEMEPVYTGPTPEELIAAAQAEIEKMGEEAGKNISFLKKRAMEEGRQEGYEAGRKQAMEELEAAKEEWKQKSAALELEFQKRVDELEPKFIETLTGIYEQIFQVELAGYKQILIHAIGNTIRHVEGSKEFLVHVSRTDYEAVMQEKKSIISKLPSQTATLEIVEDITLKENECIIETSSGIYDCSLGMQLEELTRKLRLLSYEG